jgi:hypothetical protein
MLSQLKTTGLWLILAMLVMQDHSAFASKIKPLNLTSLSMSAGLIFEGECIDIQSGKDKETGLMATWYTFKVLDAIKGRPAETETIKQYGGQEGDIVLQTQTTQYKIGEKAILFLYSQSQIGFTSSVGGNQGKFLIQEFPDDKGSYVTNGMPAMTLFEGLESSISTLDKKGQPLKGTARLRSNRMLKSDFSSFVKQMVRKQNQETQ